MINSGQYLDLIIQNLNVLRYEIISKASLGFTDLNKHCEDFVKEIFNRIYGYDLKNLNQISATYPGLDLGDETQGIAYQITSTKTSEKINETLLQCLDKKHYLKFPTIYVFILTSKQGSYTISETTAPHFAFDSKVNIKDFDDIYKDILALDLDQRKDLCEYIQREFSYYWKLVNSDGSNPTAKPEDIKPCPKPLIEPTTSRIKCRMTQSALWSIEIKIDDKLTTPTLYSALERNQLRQGTAVVPPILSHNFRQPIAGNQVRFIMPLRSYGGIANSFSEQQLLVEGNVITFESAEYHDQDILLINLDVPLATLIFLLLTIDRAKLIPQGKQVEINMKVTSSTRALIYPQYSPFSYNFAFESYEIDNNEFSDSHTIQSVTDNTIYQLVQSVYHAFICKTQYFRGGSAFLTVDRKDFDTKMHQLRQEIN